MPLKKIRFTWGLPALPDGYWRLGLFNVQRSYGPDRPAPTAGIAPPKYWRKYLHYTLNINACGALIAGGTLGAVTYFAGAGLLLHSLAGNDSHNLITYADLILPNRWGNLDRLRGESLISLGQEKLAAKDYGSALGLLRAGLARHPGDFAARAALIQLYMGMRLREPAARLIRDGFTHGYPGRPYLSLVFAFAADADRPADWVEFCRAARTTLEHLPPGEQIPDDSTWLAAETIEALIAAEDYAGALGELGRLPDAAFRAETRIRLQLLRGQAPEAAAEAERHALTNPARPEAFRSLARACLAAGDIPGMEAALDKLRALDPTKSESSLFALARQYEARRPAAALAIIEDLLFRHGANPALYPPLAAALADARASEHLDRVEQELRALGYSTHPIHWARLEIAAHTRDWPELLRQAASLRSTPGPGLRPTQLSWLGTAEHLARACLDAGAGTQAALAENISDNPGTLRLYRRTLESLLDAGRVKTAAAILTLAEGPYPSSRTIENFRARIAARQHELAQNEDAAAAAAPSADTPSWTSFEEFARDFAALAPGNDLVRQQLARLAAARRSRAVWTGDAADQLNALELVPRAHGDDMPRLQYLARSTLARGTSQPDALFSLAYELTSGRKQANAIVLLTELVRHNPDHADAVRLLTRLTAPPPDASAGPDAI